MNKITLPALLTPAKEPPLHKHDCDTCVFVCSMLVGNKIVDWWVHPCGTGKWDEIIMRNSDEGSDYSCVYIGGTDDRVTCNFGSYRSTVALNSQRILARYVYDKYKKATGAP